MGSWHAWAGSQTRMGVNGEDSSPPATGHKALDKGMGNTARRRNRRQIAEMVKPGLGDLLFLQHNGAAFIVCMKAQHQIPGKRPGLAAEIAWISDRNAYLFLHFT